MALLKPRPEIKTEVIKISIDIKILENIQQYIEWAELKKTDEFFEQAALLAFKKDKDWKKYKKT